MRILGEPGPTALLTLSAPKGQDGRHDVINSQKKTAPEVSLRGRFGRSKRNPVPSPEPQGAPISCKRLDIPTGSECPGLGPNYLIWILAPASVSFFEIDLFGLLLRDVLDDVLRSAFDQVLGFLQAEVRTDAADFLDHVDLLVAAVDEDDGEFGLLFGGFSRSGGGATSGGDGDRSGGRDAPLFFQQLREFSGFQHRQGGQFFDQLFELRHVSVP